MIAFILGYAAAVLALGLVVGHVIHVMNPSDE